MSELALDARSPRSSSHPPPLYPPPRSSASRPQQISRDLAKKPNDHYAIRAAAREERDGYGGSADNTYYLTFTLQRPDGTVLSSLATPDFILRNSQNACSDREKAYRNKYIQEQLGGGPGGRGGGRGERSGDQSFGTPGMTRPALLPGQVPLQVIGVEEPPEQQHGRPQGSLEGGNVVIIRCVGLSGSRDANGEYMTPQVSFGNALANDVKILDMAPSGESYDGQLRVTTPAKLPGGRLTVRVGVRDSDGNEGCKEQGYQYRKERKRKEMDQAPGGALDLLLAAALERDPHGFPMRNPSAEEQGFPTRNTSAEV